jgi:hypothetical protein
MILPEPEGWELMNGRFQQGLQDHFHLTAAREVRLMDVRGDHGGPETSGGEGTG